MNRIPFGPATVESGKNKGKARFLSFATGIKPEDANGLPISKNGKGESVVSVEIGAAVPTVGEFTDANEVRQYAGEHFDTFVVEAANDRYVAATRAKLTTEARKWTLLPSDLAGTIRSLCESILPESLFAPARPAGVKKQAQALAAEAAELMKTPEGQAQMLARILAMAAQGK
jgi:hypothetical protein